MPIGSGGGKPFLQIVNSCYERPAMAMTFNHSLSNSMVATALRDLLPHPSSVMPIKGDSHPLREHANLLKGASGNRAAIQNGNATRVKLGPSRPRKEAPARTVGSAPEPPKDGKMTPAQLGKSDPALPDTRLSPSVDCQSGAML